MSFSPTFNFIPISISADTDIGEEREQQEPLLNESQDDSMTLSGQPDSMSLSTGPDDDKNIKSVIDVDESITPLLGHDDDKSSSNINEVKLMKIYRITFMNNNRARMEQFFFADDKIMNFSLCFFAITA